MIGRKFTADTGVDVEYITGGTVDRLNQAKLAAGKPECDITFTTAHVGWLYANSNLFETFDLSKLQNARQLVAQARISPYHVGVWAYVYTIGYLPDRLLKGGGFDSWEGPWNPALKRRYRVARFRSEPRHRGGRETLRRRCVDLRGRQGQADGAEAQLHYKAFYSNDANSRQLFATGETPVQVVLSMNAYYIRDQGVRGTPGPLPGTIAAQVFQGGHVDLHIDMPGLARGRVPLHAPGMAA